MILRVTQFGEPVLKEPGAPVTEFNDELKSLAADMLETMHDAEGIGLAAQQVDRALRLFVMDMRVSENEPNFWWRFDGRERVPLELIMPLIAVNPEVTTSGEPFIYEEGCLSFPGIRGNISREAHVVMKYQDTDGNLHTIEADGLFGRVILHEYDHVQGVLFTERMDTRTLRGLDTKLKKLKRATRDWLRSNTVS